MHIQLVSRVILSFMINRNQVSAVYSVQKTGASDASSSGINCQVWRKFNLILNSPSDCDVQMQPAAKDINYEANKLKTVFHHFNSN